MSLSVCATRRVFDPRSVPSLQAWYDAAARDIIRHYLAIKWGVTLA